MDSSYRFVRLNSANKSGPHFQLESDHYALQIPISTSEMNNIPIQ